MLFIYLFQHLLITTTSHRLKSQYHHGHNSPSIDRHISQDVNNNKKKNKLND